MEKQKTSSLIINYIKNQYDLNTPIFVKDIYKAFPKISENTIRSLFKRYKDSGELEIVEKGVYGLPNKNSLFGKTTVYVERVIDEKYITEKYHQRVGYKSGINFANSLGLTSQTASVDTIYSNSVSNKKRVTKLKNNRIIINAPRVCVTEFNYKLLQVMDLLNNFKRYSEYTLKEATKIILQYLSNISLSEKEIDIVVSAYPLAAQVRFYKIGGQNAIKSK
jgi:predicted transcriptional regulator of viral defense system